MKNCLHALLVGLFVLATPAIGDEMHMKNGSRLIGTLVSGGGGSVVFNTEFAGDISVNSEHVLFITTDSGVTLLMKDGTVYEDKQIAATHDAMIVRDGDDNPVNLELADLDKVNPPDWEMGRGYNFFGKVGAAMLLEGGNTDNEEFDLNYEVVLRSLKDRYSSRGYFEFDEANGVRNKNKWRTVNKYDRFRNNSAEDYYGFLLAFERDEFANNDLRTYIGPYIGRQFYDSTLIDMAGEVGLVYVAEQYIDNTDDYDYPGGNWSLRLTSDWISGWLGPDATAFIDHDGIANFDDLDALILNTTVGFSLPVWAGFVFGADLRWEYDGGVVSDPNDPEFEDIKKTDTTFNFRLGYEW